MIKKDLTVLSQEDVFRLIGKEWMLITAGNIQHFNTMTASWGGLGWLWNKPVAFIFVRPERYTYEFIESGGRITLSFLPEAFKPVLNLCGSKSGREIDKIKETGLLPPRNRAWRCGFRTEPHHPGLPSPLPQSHARVPVPRFRRPFPLV